ncbi:hypothetical protein RhiirA4_455777 [Rhizophagus irregularis]|uniref:Uncharacterized protein n=1 Tax=Rhizophagus irregularis TaxID=588596 RepID=A0A2I1G606_9GLOM|nr:hypothetical protein RhiirA4_455777 [Rhizophagus irregularis]
MEKEAQARNLPGKWEDLNNLIGKKYDIDGNTLDWCRHASSRFTKKSKVLSNTKDKSKIFNNFQKKNSNSKDKVTGTNRIPLNIRTRNDREKKKDNSRGTSNQNRKSEDKKDKTKKSPRISKRKLYKEVTELKEMLKKLTDRI